MTDPQQQALPPIPAKFPGVWVPEAGVFIDISIHLREAIESRDDEWRALAASAPSREVPETKPGLALDSGEFVPAERLNDDPSDYHPV